MYAAGRSFCRFCFDGIEEDACQDEQSAQDGLRGQHLVQEDDAARLSAPTAATCRMPAVRESMPLWDSRSVAMVRKNSEPMMQPARISFRVAEKICLWNSGISRAKAISDRSAIRLKTSMPARTILEKSMLVARAEMTAASRISDCLRVSLEMRKTVSFPG